MKRLMASVLLLVLCLTLASLQALQTQPPDYEKLEAEAEKLYSQGSYALAHDLYLKAGTPALPLAEARWLKFRVADTLWRSQAGSQTADPTQYEKARQQLEVLIRDLERVEDRDRVWAEVHQSLGDFWWTRRNARDWSQAWPHYQQALDWWASAHDLELARERYLNIVWTMAKPGDSEPYFYYGYYGNFVPLEILENALKIAQTENDRAHAHYLIAMTLRQQNNQWEQRQHAPEEFEAALKPGKSTEWYDDALYNYAEWLVNWGRAIPLSDGQWRQELDYVKALDLLRPLVNEYQKGETRYYDQARQHIQSITQPAVAVVASNIFLPGSEVQYSLSWRNVRKVDLNLYKIDLSRDVQLSGKNSEATAWIQQINLTDHEKLKSWSKETGDLGDYKPGQEVMRLEGKLPVGAYLLEASAGDRKSRDLILVTDTSLLVKTSGKQALAYFCNALNGSPIAGAQIKMWETSVTNGRWTVRESTKQTNGDGLSVFDLTRTPDYSKNLLVIAAHNDRQAFSLGYSYDAHQQQDLWRIYAFTDRPAYRPGETAQWKLVVRKSNGSVYSTPAQQTIEFEIVDPRGAKVKEAKTSLNAFGSAWGSLDLTESMPLGEYRVTFWDEGRRFAIGHAILFRLEEYKLPEFKVSVQTPEENGKKKAFRLGEKVEVNVQADYYFGGPVANATAEVIVYQSPFYPHWQPPHDFPWFYGDMSPQGQNYWGAQGQEIKRESLQTDATGKATISFETPRGAQQDFEYRIEARVTDASRREMIGSGSLRVTRQRYYVYPHAKHNLYRPQDKVAIDFKALDANEQPVQSEGTVKLTRDFWYEIWLDPSSKEVKGDELKRLREKSGSFPPLPRSPAEKPWQLKFQGYQHDDILTRTVKTDSEGEAEFSFTPEREGYYRLSWSSPDKGSPPITAETTVWASSSTTSELGYRTGGVEIIVDKDTFRTGEKAPVMLSVPTHDRYVLFSLEAEDLYSYQLIHLTGTVKLFELPIEEKHVPNIFLSAAMVSDSQIFLDTKQVVIPPLKNFLQVDVKADRNEYQPRDPGTLTVTTRDQDGKPVSAEVSLGVVDESVFYIQTDYAGDPRQFYFGSKRGQQIQTQSTFYQKSYTRLVKGPQNELIDERQLASWDEEKDRLGRGGGVGPGEGGGIGGGPFQTSSRVPGGIVGGVPGGVVGGVPGGVINGSAQVAAVSESPMPTVAMKAGKTALAEAGIGPSVQVRTDFRSTVLWQPDLVTDKDGKATVKVQYPESLTSWKSMVRVATEGNQFGTATTSTRTSQPLIVRLQAPRFFVVGDQVTVSAVINNNTGTAMKVMPSLEAEGVVVLNHSNGSARPSLASEDGGLTVKANGEERADWIVAVKKPGSAKLKVFARNDRYADAMQKVLPVYEHGLEKFISKSGKMRGDDITVRLDLPLERRPGSTHLMVQSTPSLAVTLLDALPYLIDYPYGCTEQTMSRFLPAVITSKTLRDLGLQPEDVMNKIFGGIVQEQSSKTQPNGKKDLRRLDDMVKQGLERLYDFQHGDGGWGWWKQGESDHFMSAYVVWGLTLARDAGIKLKADVLDRGAGYLDKELVEEEASHDVQSWMLHALSVYHASSKQRQVGSFQAKAFDNLWTHRDQLNAYTRSLLALSALQFGYTDKARLLIQNLENGVKRDTRPDTSVLQVGAPNSNGAVMDTAHWGEDGIYWRWSEGGVEATSFALRALLAVDPKNKLIQPVTHWLLQNRRGAQWSNTRDTAITVLALDDYLRRSGELATSLEYELQVNGHSIVTKKVIPAEVLSAPSQFEIDPKLLTEGTNEIRILRKNGSGPLYFSAQASFFSLEEPITAAGNGIFAYRQYYKLVPRPTLLKGYFYDKQPLNSGDNVSSGERVEMVVTIEAKNNHEYLVFEDLKPAGLEAVQIRSGGPLFARELKSGVVTRLQALALNSKLQVEESDYTGRQRWIYQELRDRQVALFIDKLPEGLWEIRYDLRAEVPGTFHALPVVGHAMYVPEIRCNGVESQIIVRDLKQNKIVARTVFTNRLVK